MTHTLFATNSGKLIDFKKIFTKDICLEDIAHHLTNIQRFGGCMPLNIKYSVAEHSINCYRIASLLYPEEKELHRAALMHDASEAYLGDMVSGLKALMREYRAFEANITKIINKKYNLKEFTRVKEIDKRILLDEVQALVPDKYNLYAINQKYLPYNQIRIEGYENSEVTKQTFLYLCAELDIKD